MRVFGAIFAGGALGGVLRHFLSTAFYGWIGTDLLLGTFLSNLLGSLIIGFVGVLSGPDGRWRISPELRQGVLVGFCGGLTTYSFYSVQCLELFQKGELALGIGYALLTLILCLVAVYVGVVLAQRINRLR